MFISIRSLYTRLEIRGSYFEKKAVDILPWKVVVVTVCRSAQADEEDVKQYVSVLTVCLCVSPGGNTTVQYICVYLCI